MVCGIILAPVSFPFLPLPLSPIHSISSSFADGWNKEKKKRKERKRKGVRGKKSGNDEEETKWLRKEREEITKAPNDEEDEMIGFSFWRKKQKLSNQSLNCFCLETF